MKVLKSFDVCMGIQNQLVPTILNQEIKSDFSTEYALWLLKFISELFCCKNAKIENEDFLLFLYLLINLDWVYFEERKY